MSTVRQKPLITLENVSKKYKLYDNHAHRLLEVLNPFGKRYHHEFWAVKDISFKIMSGQTIGVIGRNGSGKSTLLQMIAGVLLPSTGRIDSQDKKISALLELGAGFNPALSGRENVYIHGALMGYTRKEMDLKITAIEEFADIGEFFDQPVKFYSSGMFVRLAFAAAINVAPDLLIVDEAISVGDAKFQHKCFNKFQEFQRQGVTIIFVSHDTNAVVRVCDYVILMEQGKVIKEGEPDAVVNAYLELVLSEGNNQYAMKENNIAPINTSNKSDRNETKLSRFLTCHPVQGQCELRITYNDSEQRCGDRRGEIIDYLVTVDEANESASFVSGSTMSIYVKARFYNNITMPVFGVSIKTIDGVVVHATNTRIHNIHVPPAVIDEIMIFRFKLPMPLRQGDYFIDLGLADGPQETLLDMRYSLAHVSITSPPMLFDGLVGLAIEITPININVEK